MKQYKIDEMKKEQVARIAEDYKNNHPDKVDLFTPGEWEIHNNIGIEGQTEEIEESRKEAEANAALIAESKNMFQNIEMLVHFLDSHSDITITSGSNLHKHLKAIVNRIN